MKTLIIFLTIIIFSTTNAYSKEANDCKSLKKFSIQRTICETKSLGGGVTDLLKKKKTDTGVKKKKTDTARAKGVTCPSRETLEEMGVLEEEIKSLVKSCEEISQKIHLIY